MVLRETNSIKDYWLEPGSRRVEPETFGYTDSCCKAVEKVAYRRGERLKIVGAPGRRRGVLLDFGKEVGGYLHLKFSADGCRRIEAQAAESVSHLMSMAAAETGSKVDPAIMSHRLRSRGGQVIDLPHFGGFRYLWLFPGYGGVGTLEDVWLDYTPYLPGNPGECGYFLSSDDLLNRVWFAGLHTLEMCTINPALGGVDGKSRIGRGDWVLVDGAKRDRLIWTGDLGPAGAAVYVSDFNTGAVKDSLTSLSEHQAKNGYIPACSPAGIMGKLVNGFFGDYVAWWVVCLYQYYFHTGDRETLLELFPNVKRALHFLHSQCRGGLYRQTPLNMMEWCFTVLRFGKPAYTNAMYYWALNSASFLAHEVGDDEASVGYVSRAYRLSESLGRELWDDERGVFVDTTVDRRRVPQDANSLAIVSGMVGEPAAADGILDYLRLNLWEDWGSTNVDRPYLKAARGHLPHNKRVVPFMNNYEALARFASDDRSGALELIRRCWGNMVQREPGTTFWEWVGPGGDVDNHFSSLCHGWSAGAVPLLSKHVLGIRPSGVGYGKCVVDPYLGDLEWVEGRVPTPHGFIEARAEKKKNGEVDVRTKLPRGVLAGGKG